MNGRELSEVARTVPTMTTWREFTERAPAISTIFTRRHAAANNLCMLATLRADGYPRISPMEPRVFEGELWLVGMPDTRKFTDLHRDPRFSLHTATVDAAVTDGDAKLWGKVHDVRDRALHQRFAEAVYEEIGLDLRGQEFDYFYAADVFGASSVEVATDHLDVTTWRAGHAERVTQKR